MNGRAVYTSGKRLMFGSPKTGWEACCRAAGGFSLIELLVVIAIVSILAGIGIASFAGLSQKYDVDNQTKRMYADLSNIKMQAMSKGRTHFVAVNANGYTAYDDSSPAPNGDDTLTVGSDSVVLQSARFLGLSAARKAFLPIAWNGDAQIGFNARGVRTNINPVTLCIFSAATPRYDCVNVAPVRIILGKLTVPGVCSEANCQAQ